MSARESLAGTLGRLGPWTTGRPKSRPQGCPEGRGRGAPVPDTAYASAPAPGPAALDSCPILPCSWDAGLRVGSACPRDRIQECSSCDLCGSGGSSPPPCSCSQTTLRCIRCILYMSNELCTQCGCPCWKKQWHRPRCRSDEDSVVTYSVNCARSVAVQCMHILMFMLWWRVSLFPTSLTNRSGSLSSTVRRIHPSVWIAFVLIMSISPTAALEISPQTGVMATSNEGGVCPTMDIRNNLDNFRRLQNCTVIEGFLQIVLVDNATESGINNLSFPLLKEITGYLLIYRVFNLRSLANMFPSLTIIRGQKLFMNYALVIYEMHQLNDIGLSSLVSIPRGSVRIEKNPVLCYVDTIDWNYIVHSGEHNFLKHNRPFDECPRKCPEACPKERIPSPERDEGRLCWSGSACQKVCPEKCGLSGCQPNSVECCHNQCLGSCTGPESDDCSGCKNVQVNNRCVSNCPVATFNYMGRRCLLESECRSMPPPKEEQNELGDQHRWKAFEGQCLVQCPPGYQENKYGFNGNHLDCIPCNGPCKKECNGAMIDSIAASQKFRGCSTIKGSLEIQIKSGKNIVKELEENLQSIQEIRGYLKIARSFPLVSLNFLKNLKRIGGENLENSRYSVVVLENENLQKLWDYDDIPVIDKGRIFFHFNPKLCLREIDALANKTGITNLSMYEVSRQSNGDKVACDVETLNVMVSRRGPKGALITWEPFQPSDQRTLLGYVVYTTEAPYKNVTLYDGRDACGGDGWKVEDVDPTQHDRNTEKLLHLMTLLQPYTQYAFYVKTYTIASSVGGAQSDIIYFRTLPDEPSVPTQLFAFPNSSSELVIRWKPPSQPNGNVTKYIVRGQWVPEDQDYISRRDYCDDQPSHTPLGGDERALKPTEAPAKTPDCNATTKPIITKDREEEVQEEIRFEDALHNTIYVRRSEHRSKRENSGLEDLSRFRREIQDSIRFPSDADNVPPNSVSNADFQENRTDEGIYLAFEREVIGETELVMRDLQHFSRYSIKVIACREREMSNDPNSVDLTKNCSREAIAYARTIQLESADIITDYRLERINNDTHDEYYLKWSPPKSPNGIIVRYDIKITQEFVEKSAQQTFCIRPSDGNYTFRVYPSPNNVLNNPGNYSVRISATSLYKQGNYTAKIYYIIPASSSSKTEAIVYAVVVIMFIFIMGGFGYWYVRKRWYDSTVTTVYKDVNPDYASAETYTPDEWEVCQADITILHEIGQGSFGMVYEGLLRTGATEQKCAIKIASATSDSEKAAFLNEASIMKQFRTYHVVRLYGVVSRTSPVMVAMELMTKGDLKTYLRKHRPDEAADPSIQPPTLQQIYRMALSIADGMAYLTKEKYVHRDLAARNCLLSEDLTVKIGDFGMTRDVYSSDYYRKGDRGLMPVRWMSPECLNDGVFTTATDVWSYGVVLWEMATLASQPYQGLANEQVLHYVKKGGIMEAPENCPRSLYELMLRCWAFKPQDRPSFLDLMELLLLQVTPTRSFEDNAFYYTPAGLEQRAQAANLRAPLEQAEIDDDLDGEWVSSETPLRPNGEGDLLDYDSDIGARQEDKGDAIATTSSYSRYQKPHSSDSSRGSKTSNGSGNNVPNGFLVNRNGATGHHAPNIATTEC